MQRLARMIRVGQLAAWPKLKFIANRMAIERVIQDAREATRPAHGVPESLKRERSLRNVLSEEDLQDLLEKARNNNGVVEVPVSAPAPIPQELDAAVESKSQPPPPLDLKRADSSRSMAKRWSGWFGSVSGASSPKSARSTETVRPATAGFYQGSRRGSFLQEFKRQSQVFWDPDDPETSHDEGLSEDERMYASEVEEGENGLK